MMKINTKYLIQHLIYGKIDEKICLICYKEENELKDLEQEIYIGTTTELHTLSSMLKYITKDEFTTNGGINIQICNRCEQSAIKSYLFIKQCEASIKAMDHCVDYMTEYVDKIHCEEIVNDGEIGNLLIILPGEIIDDALKTIHSRLLNSEEDVFQKPYISEKDDKLDNCEIKVEILPEIKEEFHTEVSIEEIILTKEQLNEFIQTRHINSENSIFICDSCSTLFEKKEDLVLHIKRIHQITNKSYKSLAKTKNNHLRNRNISKNEDVVKPLSKTYNCSMCAESFPSLRLLREHKQKHPEGTMHICRDCGRMYKTIMALRQHYFVHKIKTKNYLCQECGKVFIKKGRLNAHAKSHEEKIYQCPFCHIRCQTENKVTYHIKQVHRKEYNHMCDVCGKLFGSRGELGIHKDRHVVKNCPICDKGYRDQKQYKRHMMKHETGSVRYKEKKYECDYCGCWWKHKWSLVQHVYGKHLNNRPYKCGICEKGFYTKAAQLRHKIVHTKERPEVCTICKRRFVDKRSLLFHTRIHTGEKPYECSECGQKFLNASRRVAHMKSKHLEPKEECQICHKKFAWRKTLLKHLEKHNREEKEEDKFKST